jgi:hypothetical protein
MARSIFKDLKSRVDQQKVDQQKVIRRIRQHEYDLNMLLNNFTPLMVACVNKQSAIALELIQSGQGRPEYIEPTLRANALSIACIQRLPDVALALINTGQSQAGVIFRDGHTVLLDLCAENNITSEVRYVGTRFGRFGRIGTAEDYENYTPVDMRSVTLALIATRQSRPEHIAPYSRDNALSISCRNKRNTDVALALIGTGNSHPEQIDIRGYTPLMYACESGMYDVAGLLIETGESIPEHVSQSMLTVEDNFALKILVQQYASSPSPDLLQLIKKIYGLNPTLELYRNVVEPIVKSINEDIYEQNKLQESNMKVGTTTRQMLPANSERFIPTTAHEKMFSNPDVSRHIYDFLKTPQIKIKTPQIEPPSGGTRRRHRKSTTRRHRRHRKSTTRRHRRHRQ